MYTMRKVALDESIEDVVGNNVAEVTGIISSEVVYDHITGNGDRFYTFFVDVKRLSGTYDSLMVMVPEELLLADEDYLGRAVCLKGHFRSYNRKENGKSHLILYLYAKSLEFIEQDTCADTNELTLIGYICKKPVARTTPAGRIITDIMLAVNRPFGKTDYIPCIFWGRNAYYISNFEVGRQIKLIGRMQSRIYTKIFPNGTVKDLTAYEVSVATFEQEM